MDLEKRNLNNHTELFNLKTRLEESISQEYCDGKTCQVLQTILKEFAEIPGKIDDRKFEWDTAFDAIHDPIFVHDKNYRIIRANKAYAEKAEMNIQDLIGKTYWKVFPKRDGPLPQCAKLIEQHNHSSQCEEVRLNNGEIYFSRGYAVQDSQDHFLYSIHTMEDITEQRCLQSALEESEVRYRSLFEDAPDAIFLADAETGMLLDANPAAERLTGRTREEILNLHQSQLHTVNSQIEKDFNAHVQAGRAKVTHPPSEILVLHADGHEIMTEITTRVFELNGKQVIQGIFRDISARKKVENRLREQAQLLAQIHDAVISTDIDGIVTSWNQGAERLLGYTETEVLGKPVAFVYSEEDAFVTEKIIAPLKAKGAYELEVRLRRKSGEIFYAQLSLSLLRDEQGTSVGMVGYALDISERKQAEKNLYETGNKLSLSLNLLKGIIESIPLRVFWKDQELRYLGCNTLFSKDAGLTSPDDLIGKTDFDMGWKEQAELYRETDKSVLQSGIPQLGYEEPQTSLEGNIIWLRTSKVPLRNDSQEIIGILGIYDDITAQKMIENDLLRSESRLKKAQGVAHLGSWEMDLVKNELWWSDENYRIFGVEPRERNTYETFLDTVHPDDREFVNQAYMASVEKHTLFDIEHRLLMKDGSVKWVHERCKTIYADDGLPLRSSGTTLDITERRITDDRLRHSEAGFAEAQRLAHLGNWELDIVKNVLTWSNEIYHIFEIKPQSFDASYETFLAATHPDDRERVEHAYHESVKNKTSYDITHRLLMPDGQIKYVRQMCKTYYDKDDHPLRSLGTVQDITEQYLTAQALRHSNHALKALSSCNSVLIHATNETDILKNMCDVIINEGGYRFVWIGMLEDNESKDLHPVAHAGIECGYLKHIKINYADNEYGRGPAGCAARHGKLQVVHDSQTDPDFLPWREKAAECGFRSVVSLPLKKTSGEVFSVLNIYAEESHAFDEAALEWLQELTDDLAFGILSLRTRDERDHYLQEHLKSDERYKQMLVDTIRAMSLTVEKRDPYTAGHQNKVAQLSVAIGKEMGMDEDRLEGLRLGATIHDIGKIYVPAEILNRPGKLSKAEFEIIKSHAEVGYDIIKDVHFPWPVADMVIQHHERLDGSGYPRGLKGDEIIFEARILAVADVVEAITSHRPYRAAKGMGNAIKEIEAHRGTLYDDEVAESCLRLIRDEGFTFNENEQEVR